MSIKGILLLLLATSIFAGAQTTNLHESAISLKFLAKGTFWTNVSQWQPSADEVKKKSQAQQDEIKGCKVPPKDIIGGTTTDLACEWLDSNSISILLSAMLAYSNKQPDCAVKVVLDSVPQGEVNADRCILSDKRTYSSKCNNPPSLAPPDSFKGYIDLYCAAISGLNGTQKNERKVAFLEVLSKANLRNTQKMSESETDALFLNADQIITAIFTSSKEAKLALMKINDQFHESDHLMQYEALYTLLGLVQDSRDADNKSLKPYDLETLRAAYEADFDRLTSLVTTKISAR